jgi:hypothetical protein
LEGLIKPITHSERHHQKFELLGLDTIKQNFRMALDVFDECA